MSGQPLSADILGPVWLNDMPKVEMTAHLVRFLPMLEQREVWVPPGSVAEVLHAIDAISPGFCDYVLDWRSALRRHVNVCVNEKLVIDRKTLSDRVCDEDTVYIFQALSGG